ncbi:hypothetical protein [Amycolatopsis sacchari]|uniref:hypothetical protein n=1 Tax=Amycolatopsis sacchari TaxID=115433 RepID=UPI003D741C24
MTESDDERRAKGLPPAPLLPGDEPAPVDPPKPVKASFWLWVSSAVVFVIGYAVIFFARGRFMDDIVKANRNPAVSAEQIRSGTTVLLAVLLVGAISFAVLYTLFAYKARQGTRSARTVLTVLMAVTVVFQLVQPFANVITLLATLLGLIALLLMYLPQSNPYFPKVNRRAP